MNSCLSEIYLLGCDLKGKDIVLILLPVSWTQTLPCCFFSPFFPYLYLLNYVSSCVYLCAQTCISPSQLIHGAVAKVWALPWFGKERVWSSSSKSGFEGVKYDRTW